MAMLNAILTKNVNWIEPQNDKNAFEVKMLNHTWHTIFYFVKISTKLWQIIKIQTRNAPGILTLFGTDVKSWAHT